MQSAIVSNRVFLGIVAFSVSFGLSLVPNWDFSQALVTSIITLLATYAAALCVDKRRRAYELLVLSSLHKRIKELEGLKSRIIREIDKIEEHHNLLYTESNKLKNQVSESRNQRDNLHREISNFTVQKKQLESEINILQTDLNSLEKSKIDIQNSFSTLTAEKRRLELNCHTSRSEINQLQNHLSELYEIKQEIENNLIFLGRLKPQIEEKLYELRIHLQNLEIDVNEQNQLLIATKAKREEIESSLNYWETKLEEQQSELQQLQSQVSLLQEERDILQNQVWELLQQIETFHQNSIDNTQQEEDVDLFPFAEILTPIETRELPEASENFSEEWMTFMEQIPGHEIQILKAIVEQENTQVVIKQIAEANITMPNLLIDAINERANDIIGELVIDSRWENPEIYPEHIINVKKMLEMYENLMNRQASSN